MKIKFGNWTGSEIGQIPLVKMVGNYRGTLMKCRKAFFLNQIVWVKSNILGQTEYLGSNQIFLCQIDYFGLDWVFFIEKILWSRLFCVVSKNLVLSRVFCVVPNLFMWWVRGFVMSKIYFVGLDWIVNEYVSVFSVHMSGVGVVVITLCVYSRVVFFYFPSK